MSSNPDIEAVKQLIVRMPAELHRRFKIAQAYDGRSMNEVMNGMIEAWVAKREAERE